VLCRTADAWVVDRRPAESARLDALLGHLERLQALAHDRAEWWTLACLTDAWREHLELPATEELPWDRPASVLCFGRRDADASGVLVAEPHYFMYGRYLRLRAKVRLLGPPWSGRRPTGVYAGGDHGRTVELPGGGTGTPRRLLAQVVAEGQLPVSVTLGRRTTVAQQLRHRVILDVDGHARTWEAWAWKLLSGSVLVSQTSEWQTRFTTEFEPQVHYLPVRADFADLREVLDWCAADWTRAHQIARRARRRARAVYDSGAVETAAEWARVSAALRPIPGRPADKPPG
jgi:hypothetical protein